MIVLLQIDNNYPKNQPRKDTLLYGYMARARARVKSVKAHIAPISLPLNMSYTPLTMIIKFHHQIQLSKKEQVCYQHVYEYVCKAYMLHMHDMWLYKH